ncbi:hypothetical protein K438DRAFT_1983681 [Mycena galopus ATCC 62051]|nr:hypothetical protein K438DRAFT_1983681 [Mycena galopus ATCC 62051]
MRTVRRTRLSLPRALRSRHRTPFPFPLPIRARVFTFTPHPHHQSQRQIRLPPARVPESGSASPRRGRDVSPSEINLDLEVARAPPFSFDCEGLCGGRTLSFSPPPLPLPSAYRSGSHCLAYRQRPLSAPFAMSVRRTEIAVRLESDDSGSGSALWVSM